jgi:hypothetical protein
MPTASFIVIDLIDRTADSSTRSTPLSAAPHAERPWSQVPHPGATQLEPSLRSLQSKRPSGERPSSSAWSTPGRASGFHTVDATPTRSRSVVPPFNGDASRDLRGRASRHTEGGHRRRGTAGSSPTPEGWIDRVGSTVIELHHRFAPGCSESSVSRSPASTCAASETTAPSWKDARLSGVVET